MTKETMSDNKQAVTDAEVCDALLALVSARGYSDIERMRIALNSFVASRAAPAQPPSQIAEPVTTVDAAPTQEPELYVLRRSDGSDFVRYDGLVMTWDYPPTPLGKGQLPVALYATPQPATTVDAALTQEAAIWVSPEQMRAHPDRTDNSGAYLPARRTSRGKFTMPLYTTLQPAASVASGGETAVIAAARAVIDEFGSSMDGPLQRLYQALRTHDAATAQQPRPLPVVPAVPEGYVLDAAQKPVDEQTLQMALMALGLLTMLAPEELPSDAQAVSRGYVDSGVLARLVPDSPAPIDLVFRTLRAGLKPGANPQPAAMQAAGAATAQLQPRTPAGPIKTWHQRAQEAQPRSEPENWLLSFKAGYMEDEILDLRRALAAQPRTPDAPIDMVLFEHEDGRHAVALTPESAKFSRDDPKWHRVGPVSLYTESAATVAQPQPRTPDAPSENFVSIGYQYEFNHPFVGTIWRDSPDEYNGSRYIGSREVFAATPRQPPL